MSEIFSVTSDQIGDDLVVSLAVRDGAVPILLVDFHDFVLSVLDKLALAGRHDEIVDTRS